MNERKQSGNDAEQRASDYLQRRGLRPVTRNFSCPLGEIDLIMEHGETLVFVEVRFRRTHRFGAAHETVDRRKQEKLLRAAAVYLQQNPKAGRRPCRFDVVGLSPDLKQDIVWIPDAFQTS